MSDFEPITQDEAVAAGGREWIHPTTGAVRVYFDSKIWAPMIGLDVSFYNTGNVSGALLDGEIISNRAARELLAAKVWWEDGKVRTSGLPWGASRARQRIEARVQRARAWRTLSSSGAVMADESTVLELVHAYGDIRARVAHAEGDLELRRALVSDAEELLAEIERRTA